MHNSWKSACIGELGAGGTESVLYCALFGYVLDGRDYGDRVFFSQTRKDALLSEIL